VNRASIGGAALSLVLALAGCELIANLERRTLDPIEEGCTLSVEGDAHVRFANLLPGPDAVDFCVRSSGHAYQRPVLRGSGSACPAGFRYRDVSAPVAVARGSVDVKMIAAGSTCSAPALVERTDIPVDSAVVTIVRVGGRDTPSSLLALSEEPTVDQTQVRLRFVHASAGSEPLYLGPTVGPSLPTAVASRMFGQSVPFGSVPSAGAAAASVVVDPRGYLLLPAERYQLGAAAEPSDAALLAFSLEPRVATYTLFAVGDPADATYPRRGLLCDESAAATSLLLPCVETSLPSQSLDAGLMSTPSSTDGGLRGDASRASSGTTKDGSVAQGPPLLTDAQTPGPGSTQSDLDASTTSPASTPPGVGSSSDAGPLEMGLRAQYQINQAARTDFMVAPVVLIRNVSVREGVPLSSLKLRYYFTNEHSAQCPDNCAIEGYYANLSLGAIVEVERRYVQLEGKLACLEFSFEKEKAVLRQGEAVQTFQGFHTSPYLPFDQSDDYSYDGMQTSFVDSKKLTIYRDGVLVWGTPPP